jgi:biotin operon repressor
LKPIKKDPADFTMITRGYIKDIRELSKRSAVAFNMLMLIVERMDRANALVISQATLGKVLGYGRTTIHKATRLLIEERWLQVIKIGTASGYVVNSKVAWRTHNGERYASFYAEIFVSEHEQAHSIEDWNNLELKHVPVIRAGEKAYISHLPAPPPDQQGLFPEHDSDFVAKPRG